MRIISWESVGTYKIKIMGNSILIYFNPPISISSSSQHFFYILWEIGVNEKFIHYDHTQGVKKLMS